MDKRNITIQYLRAFAIIAVVLIHTCPSGNWQVVCRPFINFSVATFLFLSGYLTKCENEDWTAFFKKRILRVIIPPVFRVGTPKLIRVYFPQPGTTNLHSSDCSSSIPR